jgi:hypothetical protein
MGNAQLEGGRCEGIQISSLFFGSASIFLESIDPEVILSIYVNLVSHVLFLRGCLGEEC